MIFRLIEDLEDSLDEGKYRPGNSHKKFYSKRIINNKLGFKLAKEQCKKSTFNPHIGCVALVNGEFLGDAFVGKCLNKSSTDLLYSNINSSKYLNDLDKRRNYSDYFSSNLPPKLHAEMDLRSKLAYYMRKNPEKYDPDYIDIYIYRDITGGNGGDLKNCKPCDSCEQSVIRDLGIKNVYCTLDGRFAHFVYEKGKPAYEVPIK